MNTTTSEPTSCFWCGDKALYHNTEKGACRDHKGRLQMSAGYGYYDYDDIGIRRARRIGKERSRAYKSGNWAKR
jgi:hypothetical protein